MVSKGNKSKLSNSEICQKCANCCKTFTWIEDLDMLLRFRWIADKNIISVKDTLFNHKEVTLNSACSKLCKVDSKYVCSVWDKERPDFCNTYPDNIFNDVEKQDRKNIQKIIDWAKKDCPIFENITVDEVIEKLFED